MLVLFQSQQPRKESSPRSEQQPARCMTQTPWRISALRSYGRGRAQIPLPRLGVLGWNMYSFWNRAPKKLSCRILGEVGFYDRLKEEAWRRKESAVKIFWVLGTLCVTDSQVPFEPANKIGFWQLIEDIYFFTEKQGAVKGMRSYEEIKSILLPSWPEGEKKHKEKKILSQFLVKRILPQFLLLLTVLLTKDSSLFVKKVSLQNYSNLFCKRESKATRAWRGTQAKFETISLYRRKICSLGPYWISSSPRVRGPVQSEYHS